MRKNDSMQIRLSLEQLHLGYHVPTSRMPPRSLHLVEWHRRHQQPLSFAEPRIVVAWQVHDVRIFTDLLLNGVPRSHVPSTKRVGGHIRDWPQTVRAVENNTYVSRNPRAPAKYKAEQTAN